MLIRDAHDDRGAPAIEVCMLRRNLASEFVAGVYVFPGGSVDPEDRGPAAESLCRGRTDAEASAILGIESGGLAFWVAALREGFEEAGGLLAHPREQRSRLLDVCRQEDLVLATDAVHYVSHWITPELAPRRYDTRFFITAAPRNQVARHDDGETIATIWVRPAQALARHGAGEIELLPPTIANLRNLEPFDSTSEVMAWASQVTDVVTVLPIVLIEDGHVLVLRPGDEGYEQALSDRQASGFVVDEALSDAARAVWGSHGGTA